MILIHARNASEWTGPTGNNTYVLPGRAPALVDAGVGNTEHLDAVAAALGGAALVRVLITHGHPDHAAGIPAIVSRWPRVDIVRHPHVRDGDYIEAGGTRLRAIATPGHAPDHVCYLDEDAGDLYCGDMLRLDGTIVIPASKGGNLRDYLQSLRKLRALGASRLLPGHGPVVTDPSALIDEYLRHRAMRERQIVEALEAGCATAEAIVERIYGPLPAAIAGAAADSVTAHLVKLRDEGSELASRL